MDADFVRLRRQAFLYLLKAGQEELSELEEMILKCAAEAKLTKDQWKEILEKVGAEKIEDLLELHSEDYENCTFKPLVKRRLVNFQTALYAKYWIYNIGSRDRKVIPTAAPPASRAPPAPPAPAAPPGTE